MMQILNYSKKTICAIVLLSALFCFTNGCTSSNENESMLSSPQGELSAQNVENADSSPNLSIKAIEKASTPSEAMENAIKRLEAANVAYQYILRDSIYYHGKEIPAQWLFAVNAYGEWVDVLIMEDDQKLTEIWNDNTLGIKQYRKIEPRNVSISIGEPLNGGWGYGATTKFESDNHSFHILITGYPYVIYDLTHEYGWDVYSAEEQKYVKSGKRPENWKTVDPNPWGLKTYAPENTMEAELAAMQKHLEDTGRGYTWEMKDSITIDGKDYPVQWMYAKDEAGEWVDVIFTENTDLLYKIHDHRDILTNLRNEDREEINRNHPGRADENVGFIDNWTIADFFYKGYGFYMTGYGLSFGDCGNPAIVIEWSDEYKGFTTFYSRELIFDVNVFPE